MSIEAESSDSPIAVPSAPVPAGISVVILTKNEAINLSRCLRSLNWCDDILVLDSGSTDETREIAESFQARVLCHPFESFAQQRNWALEQGELKYPWVLMLDADEVVTPEFQVAVHRQVRLANAEVAGFMICRKTIFLGRWLRYSDAFPVWIVRVVRRGQASFVAAGHGEKAVAGAGQSFVKIDEPILHYAFSKGISEWVDRHNRYSSQEARAELQAVGGAPVSWMALCATDPFRRRQALLALRRRLPGRPLWRFLYQYFWRRGILEGRAGLAYCVLMSFFEALIVVKRREITLQDRATRTTPDDNNEPALRVRAPEGARPVD